MKLICVFLLNDLLLFKWCLMLIKIVKNRHRLISLTLLLKCDNLLNLCYTAIEGKCFMKTIGFIKSSKENEKRVAILPKDLEDINHVNELYFEKGYGLDLGIQDQEYRKKGAHVCSQKKALECDIICDPKIGDASYIEEIKDGSTIFGYVHAAQNKELTDLLIDKNIRAIAWEEMFHEKEHLFWRNNELAGEAAVLHAFTFFGKMPYDCNVALIGRGNTARGALRILNGLGAKTKVYNRKTVSLLPQRIENYDVIVNCVLWDMTRGDHILYQKDIEKMKPFSMIIDVSSDTNGAIEGSHPTTIEEPVSILNHVLYYAVDHTPSILFYTASKIFSQVISKKIDFLVENDLSLSKDLQNAIIINKGKILDEKISSFQDN